MRFLVPPALLCIPLTLLCFSGGCGDDETTVEPSGITTEHCSFAPVPATARAGGVVEAGPILAGAAEAVLDVPVGTALGAYTARAGFIGGGANVDVRDPRVSAGFNPSIGIETAPMVKALALTAAGETVIVLKADLGLMYEGLLFDLEQRLGAELAGKVIVTASHSHSAWGQHSGHTGLMVGVGQLRDAVYDAFLAVFERVARDALDARRPARVGVFADRDFDPGDALTRDRRGENDDLMGGSRKDDTLVMIRVEGTDGEPIAAVPVFGVHGTLGDADNNVASTDAIGGLERAMQEQFDRPVVVMHLQGAAGDVSPRGYGSIDCELAPGNDGDPCATWLRAEGHGRIAAPVMMAAWDAAGQALQDTLALEMVTRSIELGPDPATFTIRGGALAYAPFDPERPADGQVVDAAGALISPIDEFNAPVGAALCETGFPLFPAGAMPGTEGLAPYGSCVRIDAAAEVLGPLIGVEFEADERRPICQTTRTTVSALRLGDFVLGTLPGEPTVWAADLIRESSPVSADRTIVVGYAQGHIGYLLRPEDWVRGGYEPSIGFWGPLEGEYVMEQLAALMPLVMTPEREDAAAGGADRVDTPRVVDDLPIDDPGPMAGVIPGSVPDEVWLRSGAPASPQPDPFVPRIAGLARFVWIGDDPLVATPRVTLERESTAGVFEPVVRRSGRPVTDGDVIVTYTPQPLRRVAGEPQTHYWAVEWQAVPWLGALDDAGADIDGLDARGAVPLGRYRFRVRGAGFDITSDPFEVIPGVLAVTVAQDATVFTIGVRMHAPKGYRLLTLDGDSNAPVALRDRAVTVILETAGDSSQMAAVTDADGRVIIDAGAQAGDIERVRVIDQFGNEGSVFIGKI